MMTRMRRSSSARAASINCRLRSRRKEAGLPSLVATLPRMPLPLKVAWVRHSGWKIRGSSERIQRAARALLPTPLGPLRSMTERSAAVWWRCPEIFCAAGVSSQSLSPMGAKGTALAPHWRARCCRSGSFFIIKGSSKKLAVELPVHAPGQPEALAAVIDFHPGQGPRIKAQAHFQAAQGQVHFVELIVQAHGAVLAHDAQELRVKELLQIQLRIQRAHLAAAVGEAFIGTHADAFVPAHVINTLQPVGQPGVELRQAGRGLAGQTDRK